MQFTNLNFIFRFLPAFFIIYLIFPPKYRNKVLFAGSIVFIAIGDLKYTPLLLLFITVSFFSAVAISNLRRKESLSRTVFVATVIFFSAVLLYFKYVSPNMPLGISFYTFTCISYISDVYMGNITIEKSFINLGAYISCFPKLISGPIALYSGMRAKKRRIYPEYLEEGMSIFIIGLAYKVIIADHLAVLFNDCKIIGFESLPTALAWLCAYGFSMQLYFDFQGYSLMAIGIGKMLGFNLPKNFDHPYRSRSVSEFYRRWHMTLGTWFKKYLYIPLGGNRKGISRTVFNLFVVWIVTGMWHGATMNFVLWGFVLFMFIAAEKLGLKNILYKHLLLSKIYIYIVMPVTWVIFAVSNTSDMISWLSSMFFMPSDTAVGTHIFFTYIKTYWMFFAAGAIVSLPFFEKICFKLKGRMIFKLLLLAVMLLCVYDMAGQSGSPFLYFKF
ncbi:MAG: MBOAT family protein [Clostridia bacterium]|nr:MBOAT family protein [Clostridia bacterium]